MEPINVHPNETVMRELIHDQWMKDSIFAAVVDEKGYIIAKGWTTVEIDHDPTAHAEINAIRSACKKMMCDKFPAGYWLYTTFEPCPLCSSAAIWAGVEGIVYANNPQYRGNEENWSFITCEELLKAGKYIRKIKLVKNYLLDEIKDYFEK